MIAHHVHLRPTLDGSRVIDVTLELSAAELNAAAHGVRLVVEERYRIAALESVDEILAMRELTSLADELTALGAPGAINRLTLTVAGIGRLRTALEDFAESRADGAIREGDAEALPLVYPLIDGVADAHGDAMRAALDDSVELRH
jgi:hypothetical protein